LDNFKKKISVLHIHTLPVVSGSGINTFLTMHLSDKSKFISSLACKPNGKLETLVKTNGYKFFSIQNFSGPVNPIKDLKTIFELLKLLKKNNFDIIHTHNSKAGFLGRLAGKINGKVKIIHTVHGFSFHEKEKWYKRYMFLFLEKLAASWADHLIFISSPLIEWAKKENLIKQNYSKIYSGIELDKFDTNKNKKELKQKFNISSNAFVVGEVAKLWDGKGHITILKAAKLLKNKITDLKILFVGEGNLRPILEKKIKEYDLENIVEITGFMNDVTEITSVMDIALLISDFEGMGRVILEAMACKIPVIGTKVGGIVDLIQNEKTGLLISPNNPKILADKILFLYNNPEIRQNLIKNAYKKINEKFTAKSMVKKINKIYLQEMDSIVKN
jgi:glycosyltransferase involved in cell wall biosynthesis